MDSNVCDGILAHLCKNNEFLILEQTSEENMMPGTDYFVRQNDFPQYSRLIGTIISSTILFSNIMWGRICLMQSDHKN
jgi:hypothetical protein